MTKPSSGAIGNVIANNTLTEMAMGYARSRVLCAAARLGVADALGDSERSVDELAGVCHAHPESFHRLLRTLASFDVVRETRPAHFVLTQFGRPLRKDVPGSEWNGIIFWGDLLADCWSYLTECVRTGENAHRIAERAGVATRWSQDAEANAIFRAVMGTAPAEDYAPIAHAWNFTDYHVVADLGGGGGSLLAAVLTAFPHLRGVLVDRPESVSRAQSRFEAEGLAARCKLVGADLSERVPEGADVHMLKHMLHGYQDEGAMKILRNCRQVLPREGRLLIIEFILPEVVDHADPELETRLMSDLNMLAVTAGKERTEVEWRTLLEKSGFDCRKIIPVPGGLVSIIEASPAG